MKTELTGREIGEKCGACGKVITEHDGDHSHRVSMPHECTCEVDYLNWHGEVGPGKRLRDIIAHGSPAR